MTPRPLPFTPISRFYQRRFGGKIYKIPLAIAEDCPNRQGLKGMQTCVFCDVWGSAAREEAFDLKLEAQVEKFKLVIQKRYKAEQFLAYFQAYTNTFLKLQSLRQNFDAVLQYPYVKGLVLGTRPDCISQGVLELWQEYQQKTFVAVELGVQSFFDSHLQFFRRGHSAQDSIDAVFKIAKATSVNLGIHLIFGAPGESLEQAKETALICNSLPIQNVKLHNLHVLKNTPLEESYRNGNFQPLELNEYAERVAIFLDHLAPHIHVHRLAAYAPRWEDLVAPRWTNNKMGSHQALVDWLHQHQHWQGKEFQVKNLRSFKI